MSVLVEPSLALAVKVTTFRPARSRTLGDRPVAWPPGNRHEKLTVAPAGAVVREASSVTFRPFPGVRSVVHWSGPASATRGARYWLTGRATRIGSLHTRAIGLAARWKPGSASESLVL